MTIISTPQIPGYTGVYFNNSNQRVPKSLNATYTTYRAMRKNPTIALARGLSIAPIIVSDWTVEADDDASEQAIMFISEWVNSINQSDLRSRISAAGCDYGWFGGEIIYDFDRDGNITANIKQLIPDLNAIAIDTNGYFDGFIQSENIYTTSESPDIPVEKSLIVSFRVEGQYWYGQSLLDNALAAYNAYVVAEDSAARYDTKIAGSQYKVKYPDGQTTIDGEQVSYNIIANRMLESLNSGYGVAYPATIADTTQSTMTDADIARLSWDISILEDAQPRQSHFVDRLKYLDTLMIRSILIPERAVSEGVYGTKAEAEAHADLALTYAEYQQRVITDSINKQIIDRLVTINFGSDQAGKVRLKPLEIVDEKTNYLKSIYEKVLGNSANLNNIDIDTLMDELGVPKNQQVVQVNDNDEVVEPENSTEQDDNFNNTDNE